jgi:hypothetical protein
LLDVAWLCTVPQSPVFYLLSSIPYQSRWNSLGDPSYKVNLVELILFARLVDLVREKSVSIRIFCVRNNWTNAIKVYINVTLLKRDNYINITLNKYNKVLNILFLNRNIYIYVYSVTKLDPTPHGSLNIYNVVHNANALCIQYLHNNFLMHFKI